MLEEATQAVVGSVDVQAVSAKPGDVEVETLAVVVLSPVVEAVPTGLVYTVVEVVLTVVVDARDPVVGLVLLQTLRAQSSAKSPRHSSRDTGAQVLVSMVGHTLVSALTILADTEGGLLLADAALRKDVELGAARILVPVFEQTAETVGLPRPGAPVPRPGCKLPYGRPRSLLRRTGRIGG